MYCRRNFLCEKQDVFTLRVYKQHSFSVHSLLRAVFFSFLGAAYITPLCFSFHAFLIFMVVQIDSVLRLQVASQIISQLRLYVLKEGRTIEGGGIRSWMKLQLPTSTARPAFKVENIYSDSSSSKDVS